jgi:hypothetical protein
MNERHLETNFDKAVDRLVDAVEKLSAIEALTTLKPGQSAQDEGEIDLSLTPEQVVDIVGARIQGSVSHALAGIDQDLVYDDVVTYNGLQRRALTIGETGFACLAPTYQMGLIELVANAKNPDQRPAQDADWKAIGGQLTATFKAKLI